MTRPSGQPPRPPAALAALRGEVGSEQEMSFNRLVFALAIFAYLLTAGRSVAAQLLPDLALWGALALGVFLHGRVRPGRSTPRRAFALLLDMGGLSWLLHVGGEASAFFFLIYLWVVIGNGVRFGVKWLFAALGVFLAGFGAVVLTTPYWQEQPHLAAGLMVGPCALATYAAALIRKLSDARQQAEAASEAKSLFLTSVSHELRTPLNAIIGMGGLLRETKLDREQAEMGRTIDGAAKSLLSMINGILDFARIEAGAGVRRADPFDLHALLEDVRRMLLAQAREKGLRLLLHVTPRTPARIVGDEGHVRDVLLNLVGNAVKFTEAGEVVIAADATGGRSRAGSCCASRFRTPASASRRRRRGASSSASPRPTRTSASASAAPASASPSARGWSGCWAARSGWKASRAAAAPSGSPRWPSASRAGRRPRPPPGPLRASPPRC